jgi:hypothetical protein
MAWCVACGTAPATRTVRDQNGMTLQLCASCPSVDQIRERAEAIRATWSPATLRRRKNVLNPRELDDD